MATVKTYTYTNKAGRSVTVRAHSRRDRGGAMVKVTRKTVAPKAMIAPDLRRKQRSGAISSVKARKVQAQRTKLKKTLGPGFKKKLGGGHGTIAKAKRQAASGNKKAAKKVRIYNRRRTRALKRA